MKPVPFTIDRSQWGSLIEQMTDGLRRAIRTGHYRPGDKLPSVRELVAHFGVSNRVPVAAIKKLREEGLVEAAPRNGCIVRHSRMPHWKGHVMCVVASGDFSFSTAMKVERIREAVALRNSDETTFDLIVAISVSNIWNASFLYSMSGSRWP